MLKDFSDWNIYEGNSEGSGRSEKIWIEKDNQTALFKFPKTFKDETNDKKIETTKEYISEKLASIIAERIGIKSAKIDIGLREGRIGCVSYNIKKDDEILFEGISFITAKFPKYNPNILYDEETKCYYSIDMIEKSLKKIFIDVPKEIYKMMIFDYIIGNNDRHQNNWAFLFSTKEHIDLKFSPLYDNGSSLCSFINDNKIKDYLGNDKLAFQSLVDTKSKSIIRIDGKNKKQPTHLEVVKFLKKKRSEYVDDFAKYAIKNLNASWIENTINSFDNIITEDRKKLLIKYLNKKIEMLKEIFYEE